MAAANDWRIPLEETGNAPPRYSDIAIGYVRRNPQYRAAYQHALQAVKRGRISADDATAELVRCWGISFHADPASPYDPHLIVTRPDLSPENVILGHAPPEAGRACPLDMHALGPVRATMRLDACLHIILADADGDVPLWLLDKPDCPLAMILPLGADLAVSMAAAERMRRRLKGLRAGPLALRPPPSCCRHHRMLLRTLDGRAAGASRRELAAILIDVAVRGFNAAEWVECRERKRIGRWLAEATELRDGGYIRLLRGG